MRQREAAVEQQQHAEDLPDAPVVDPVGLERDLAQVPGVVCVGLFARRPADVVIVGGEPPQIL